MNSKFLTNLEKIQINFRANIALHLLFAHNLHLSLSSQLFISPLSWESMFIEIGESGPHACLAFPVVCFYNATLMIEPEQLNPSLRALKSLSSNLPLLALSAAGSRQPLIIVVASSNSLHWLWC